MKPNQVRRILVLTAAVLPLTGGLAVAQQRVNTQTNTGANPQIGSGGVNRPIQPQQPIGYGNEVLYRNVTGGRGFRGNVPYGDPRAFRGTSSSTGYDAFVRNTTGVTTSGNLTNFAQTVQTFYGTSRFVAPPTGYERAPGTGTYIASRATYDLPDIRLGAPAGQQTPLLPMPGQYAMPGQVDPKIAPRSMRQPVTDVAPDLNVAELTRPEVLSSFTVVNRLGNAGVDPESLVRARQELQSGSDPNAPRPPVEYGTPVDSTVPSQVGSTPVGGERSTGSNVLPTESNVKPLAEAARQSTQIAALQERLREFYETRYGIDPTAVKPVTPPTPQEEPKRPEDEPGAKPPVPGTGGEPSTPDNADQPKPGDDNMPLPPRPGDPGVNQPKPKPKPVRVTSLAAGVQARGLADLMQNAETLMREGKYSSAIRQYEAAEQVAPNNGLVLIGRATAELGASFYRRADTSLREAFLLDPSMLMAQYDLRQLVGEDRLQFVVRELKELANKEPQNASPLFLLAFIAYNTGNEVNAAGYLDQADKRSGGNDAVIRMVREHWSLPASDQNK